MANPNALHGRLHRIVKMVELAALVFIEVGLILSMGGIAVCYLGR